jgi:hypothetical protein
MIKFVLLIVIFTNLFCLDKRWYPENSIIDNFHESNFRIKKYSNYIFRDLKEPDFTTIEYKFIGEIPDTREFFDISKGTNTLNLSLFYEEDIYFELRAIFDIDPIDNGWMNLKLKMPEVDPLIKKFSQRIVVYIAIERKNTKRFYRSRLGNLLNIQVRYSLQSEDSELGYCQKPLSSNILSNNFIRENFLNNGKQNSGILNISLGRNLKYNIKSEDILNETLMDCHLELSN